MKGYTRGRSGVGKTSSVWHASRLCSGAWFSENEAMGSEWAEKNGYSPCEVCSDGEWPHERQKPEAE